MNVVTPTNNRNTRSVVTPTNSRNTRSVVTPTNSRNTRSVVTPTNNNRNRRSEWSHLHTITGIVEESDHTHNQPGVQGCDAGPVQNDDIASVDFTEHVMLSLADLISERKNLFFDKNHSSIFSFFLFCSGVGISVCRSQNQDTFPTSKAMLYTCSTKVASSSPEQWISKFSCSIRFSNWFLWKGKMTNKKIQSCC